MLRIAMVTPHFAPSVGGVELHVASIVKELVRRGCAVEILTHGIAGAPMVEQIDGCVVRRFPVVGRGAYTWAPSLALYLRRHHAEYDIVHAHQYHNPCASVAAFATDRPLVLTPHFHGTGHTIPARILHHPYRSVGHALFRRADAIVAVSRSERDRLERAFPDLALDVFTIPGGVDAPEIRSHDRYPVERPVVLVASRLERYKQVDAVLRAAALLPEFDLVVCGDGSERAALEELARSLGISDRASILGRVDDETLRRWQRTASVYVTMSRHEAQGLASVEALVAGAAVVASSIPAHVETATSAHGAMLVLPPDAAAIDVAQAIRLAGSRRPTGLEFASWSDTAGALFDVYQRLVESTVCV